MSFQNTNASGDTRFLLKNSGAGSMGMQVTGSNYLSPSNGAFYTQGGLNSMGFVTDGDVSSGGSGYMFFSTGGYTQATQERMRITSTGTVGIGTTTPQFLLDVNSSSRIVGTNSLILGGSTSSASDYTSSFSGAAGAGTTKWKPRVDETTAFQFQNAGGTPVLNINTTSSAVRIGASTSAHILGVHGEIYSDSTVEGNNIKGTTFNGNTITTGTGTLTLAAGKTFTANNSITLTGTDVTTYNLDNFSTSSNSLADFYTDASTSGTGETDLYTYTLPANKLANNGDKLNIYYALSNTAISGSNAFYFGGTSLYTSSFVSAISLFVFEIKIIRVTSSTMRVSVINHYDNTIYTNYLSVTGLDFTTTNVIKITGTAASNSIIAKMGYIKYEPYAH